MCAHVSSSRECFDGLWGIGVSLVIALRGGGNVSYRSSITSLSLDHRQLLDGLPDSVIACDADGTIVYANRALEHLLGWNHGELLDRSLTEITPARLRDAPGASMRHLLGTGRNLERGRPFRVTALSRRGEELEVEVTLSTIYLSALQPLTIFAMRDVRDRLALERKFAAGRMMHAAAQLATELTQVRNWDHLFFRAASSLGTHLEATRVEIWRHQLGQSRLVLEAIHGERPGLTQLGAVVDMGANIGLLAQTARSGMPQLIADFQLGETGMPNGTQAVFYAPLQLSGMLYGVLVCAFPQKLEPEGFQVLRTVTALLATILEDASAIERERKMAERTARLQGVTAELSRAPTVGQVLGVLMERGLPTVQPHGGFIGFLSPKGDHLNLARAVGWGAFASSQQIRIPMQTPSPATEAARTGVPIFLDGLTNRNARYSSWSADDQWSRGYRAWAALPLWTESQRLGVLFLCFANERPFPPEEQEYLISLSRQCAQALERSRLYEELSQAVRIRDDFISIASHELRTPLAALELQLEGIDRNMHRVPSFEGRERMQNRASAMIRQVDRLKRLVEELLDVSRIESGRFDLRLESVDLVTLIRDVLAHHELELERARCQVNLQVPMSAPGKWDRTRVEELLSLLLSNAIKYGTGRPIDIHLSLLPQSAPETLNMPTPPTGTTVMFTVRDHGIGIAPEDQLRIFERFERAVSNEHYGGLGLGLWIARRIAQAHGGSIDVASNLGSGATFRVLLPMDPPKRMQQVDMPVQTKKGA